MGSVGVSSLPLKRALQCYEVVFVSCQERAPVLVARVPFGFFDRKESPPALLI
jgi:hypothetical protein